MNKGYSLRSHHLKVHLVEKIEIFQGLKHPIPLYVLYPSVRGLSLAVVLNRKTLI